MTVHSSEPSWLDGRPLPPEAREALDTLPLDDLIELVFERCSSAVFSQHTHDTEFMDRLRESIAQNAHALREVLVGRATLDDVALDHVLEFATVQARLRVPQKSMQRSYRVSFYTQWEVWNRHLIGWIEQEKLSAEETASILSQLTGDILTYQDHVASLVAETYTRDYESLNRSRAHVRKTLVREVLRGGAGELSASDQAILAYALEVNHVAVLMPDMPEGAASQLADGLRTATRAHQTMVYPLTLGSTVIWLGKLDPWGQGAMDALGNVLGRVGATASISNPVSGAEGFTQALRQAEDTERVRSAWGRGNAPVVMRYADAGLEILLMQNDELARTFVVAELGPLAQGTTEAARLRETLDASFRYGSHVAAAQHLNLHEHTVRNRLHKAEELLGHSLQERRTELQVAVRLVRLLGDPD